MNTINEENGIEMSNFNLADPNVIQPVPSIDSQIRPFLTSTPTQNREPNKTRLFELFSSKTKKRKQPGKNAEINNTKKNKPDIRDYDFYNIPSKPKENGYRQSLKNVKSNIKPKGVNSNIICPAILNTGKKSVSKKYYFPSEFPTLTNLKPVIPGKKKLQSTRKHVSKN